MTHTHTQPRSLVRNAHYPSPLALVGSQILALDAERTLVVARTLGLVPLGLVQQVADAAPLHRVLPRGVVHDFHPPRGEKLEAPSARLWIRKFHVGQYSDHISLQILWVVMALTFSVLFRVIKCTYVRCVTRQPPSGARPSFARRRAIGASCGRAQWFFPTLRCRRRAWLAAERPRPRSRRPERVYHVYSACVEKGFWKSLERWNLLRSVDTLHSMDFGRVSNVEIH